MPEDFTAPPENRKEHLLKRSPVFCMFPWVTMEIRPNGDVRPCYPFMDTERVGNVRDAPLAAIWNSPEMLRLRLNLLAEKPMLECRHCYRLEKAGIESFRQVCNKNYAHDFALVEGTSPDGRLPGCDVRHFSLWLSNACNFKCRMCWPKLSSSWYEDAKALGLWPVPDEIVRPFPASKDLFDQIDPLLGGLEEIFFAGGEPLIIEEHYEILERLVAKKLFHVRLNYTTNFSMLHLKEKDVANIWNQFDDVYVCASLDGMGRRGEYLRKGQRWDQIERNRERIREICPKVRFQVTCTVSAINAWHVPDFHAEWLRKGYIGRDDFLLDVLTGPDFLNVSILPPRLKAEIAKKYDRHVQDVIRPCFGAGQSKDEERFLGVAKAVLRDDRPHLIPKFKEVTGKLDELRGERLLDVFPELGDLYDFRLEAADLDSEKNRILDASSARSPVDSAAEVQTVRYDLIEIYRLQKRWDKVAEEFEKLVRVEPNDSWARLELARSYMRIGRFDQAEEEAKKVSPDDARCSQMRASILRELAIRSRADQKSARG